MAWNADNPKPCITICVPHFGKVDIEWARNVLGPLQCVPVPNFDKNLLLMRGILNIDTERNELVKAALANARTTHLLFLDTDVMPEMDANQALNMLLTCNVPIVSGLYRAKQKTGFVYAMWQEAPNKQGYVPIMSWTPGSNFLRADAIGFGFVLLKREVFEKIPQPWFKWEQSAPSEDFYFCRQCIDHGYTVNVFTDVKCSHFGNLKIPCDGIEKVTLPDV